MPLFGELDGHRAGRETGPRPPDGSYRKYYRTARRGLMEVHYRAWSTPNSTYKPDLTPGAVRFAFAGSYNAALWGAGRPPSGARNNGSATPAGVRRPRDPHPALRRVFTAARAAHVAFAHGPTLRGGEHARRGTPTCRSGWQPGDEIRPSREILAARRPPASPVSATPANRSPAPAAQDDACSPPKRPHTCPALPPPRSGGVNTRPAHVDMPFPAAANRPMSCS